MLLKQTLTFLINKNVIFLIILFFYTSPNVKKVQDAINSFPLHYSFKIINWEKKKN